MRRPSRETVGEDKRAAQPHDSGKYPINTAFLKEWLRRGFELRRWIGESLSDGAPDRHHGDGGHGLPSLLAAGS